LVYGGVEKYPVNLISIYGEKIINNETELYETFFTEYAGLIKQNPNIKIQDVLSNLGIKSTQIFFDTRTRRLLDTFEFYEFNPQLAFDNELWFHTVKTCKRLYRQSKL